ncbi:hypothetical protein KSC_070990 [Ktedonobacter sp. SOSP1-52]|nr:hypothetical protein KSC_070990 [Ktedonobacter sp. SOSP1-52]
MRYFLAASQIADIQYIVLSDYVESVVDLTISTIVSFALMSREAFSYGVDALVYEMSLLLEVVD